MTDEERKYQSEALESMWNSTGGKILRAHIDEEIVDGWTEFLELPPDKKTSKASFAYQAKYLVLKRLKEWVESEIRLK